MFIAPSTDGFGTPSSSPTKAQEDQRVSVKVAQDTIARGRGNTTAREGSSSLAPGRVTKRSDYDCHRTPLVVLVLCILTACMGFQIVREQGQLQV
ncbi:MAG: hypothetical protein JSR76_06595 [Verrucomicrobia bacterium]|nr:hypothetical protein [Verrucomicrobiota bacterium]